MSRSHLTHDQIRTIFASRELPRELASQFGVSTFTVYAIQHRAAHAKITADQPEVVRVRRRGPKPKPKPKSEPEVYRPNVVIRLTDAEICAIYTSSESDRDEAQRYRVKPGLIRSIRDRSIFAYVTMDLRRPRPAIEPEPDQDVQNRGPSRGRFPPTPGVDFQSLASAHRDLERPKGTKRAIRIKPGYQDAPLIIAYLIPLNSRT